MNWRFCSHTDTELQREAPPPHQTPERVTCHMNECLSGETHSPSAPCWSCVSTRDEWSQMNVQLRLCCVGSLNLKQPDLIWFLVWSHFHVPAVRFQRDSLMVTLSVWRRLTSALWQFRCLHHLNNKQKTFFWNRNKNATLKLLYRSFLFFNHLYILLCICDDFVLIYDAFIWRCLRKGANISKHKERSKDFNMATDILPPAPFTSVNDIINVHRSDSSPHRPRFLLFWMKSVKVQQVDTSFGCFESVSGEKFKDD